MTARGGLALPRRGEPRPTSSGYACRRSSYVTERLIGDVATVRALHRLGRPALRRLRAATACGWPRRTSRRTRSCGLRGRPAKPPTCAAGLARTVWGFSAASDSGSSAVRQPPGGPVNVLTDRHASVIASADGLTVYGDNIAGKF